MTLSLKNDVYVPVFRIRMFLGLPDPHPDPLVRDTDPRIRIRIRIRIKMSRIPNTDFMVKKNFYFYFSVHHFRLEFAFDLDRPLL
jgi:hypothetical protein